MRAFRGMALVGVLAFGAAGCNACRNLPDAATCTLVEDGFGPPGTVEVKTEVVVNGLEVPWAIAFLPDGDLLVTERPGRIRLVEDGALVPGPVATVGVDPGGEGGLQGLALHPDFATNRLFFIYFTAEEDGARRNRLERWTLSEDHRSASLDKVLLEGIPAAQYHHGGRLRVGPDGMLYVSIGDAREPDLAQDPNALNGKLLRLTPDGDVPADNPEGGRRAWLSGLRNVEGFDWRDADTLLITDHGPSGELARSGHDEVTVARKGDNLGWPEIYRCETRDGLVSPSISWVKAAPPGGAAIYTGTRIPEWKGSLLIGTLGSRHLQRVVFGEDGVGVAKHETYFLGDPPNGLGRLRETIMGPDGELYVTTSNCDGRGSCPATKDAILRVVPGP